MTLRANIPIRTVLALASAACAVSIGVPALADAPPEPPIGLPEPAKQVDPIEKIEDPAQIRPAFDKIVVDLGSPDFAIRQRASDRLNRNEQFTLELMEGALGRKDLSLEARYRLFGVARQRFYRSPRAALGFRFGEQLRDPAVVGETFPPFPSAKILEPGDMIVRADGVKLEGPAARPVLQSIIVSHDPGEVLHVTIRRGSRKMDLDLPLGKFVDLGAGGGMLSEDRLARAWRFRMQARMGGIAEPIRVAAPGASWTTNIDDAQRRLEIAMRREGNDNPLRFVGGGMPRSAMVSDEARMFEQVMRPQMMVINGQVRMVNMPAFRNGMGGFMGDFELDSGLVPMKPEEQLAGLLRMRQAYEQQIGNVDVDALPANDPRRAEVQEIKKKIFVISKQEDAISAEKQEAMATQGKPKPPPPLNVDANAPPDR